MTKINAHNTDYSSSRSSNESDKKPFSKKNTDKKYLHGDRTENGPEKKVTDDFKVKKADDVVAQLKKDNVIKKQDSFSLQLSKTIGTLLQSKQQYRDLSNMLSRVMLLNDSPQQQFEILDKILNGSPSVDGVDLILSDLKKLAGELLLTVGTKINISAWLLTALKQGDREVSDLFIANNREVLVCLLSQVSIQDQAVIFETISKKFLHSRDFLISDAIDLILCLPRDANTSVGQQLIELIPHIAYPDIQQDDINDSPDRHGLGDMILACEILYKNNLLDYNTFQELFKFTIMFETQNLPQSYFEINGQNSLPMLERKIIDQFAVVAKDFLGFEGLVKFHDVFESGLSKYNKRELDLVKDEILKNLTKEELAQMSTEVEDGKTPQQFLSGINHPDQISEWLIRHTSTENVNKLQPLLKSSQFLDIENGKLTSMLKKIDGQLLEELDRMSPPQRIKKLNSLGFFSESNQVSANSEDEGNSISNFLYRLILDLVNSSPAHE